LQVLHAATYGTFHMASILYMDVWVPPDLKTIGQAVNNALTYGLGLMIGFFFSGYLYQAAGPTPMYWTSGLVALGGALVFGAMLRFVPQRSMTNGGEAGKGQT
jgi:PPP family 3-phenylpropionic acid transporter